MSSWTLTALNRSDLFRLIQQRDRPPCVAIGVPHQCRASILPGLAHLKTSRRTRWCLAWRGHPRLDSAGQLVAESDIHCAPSVWFRARGGDAPLKTLWKTRCFTRRSNPAKRVRAWALGCLRP